jgi:hypothetical protein
MTSCLIEVLAQHSVLDERRGGGIACQTHQTRSSPGIARWRRSHAPFSPSQRPLDAPDPPTEGWWSDPLSSDDISQRYYDGSKWTPYVSGRSSKRWTDIFPDEVNTEVDPEALGIPRPPASPEPPPEPPAAGWWEDPLERKLKQARYFDGTQWTDLVAPTKSEGPRLVTRRRDPKEVIREKKAAQAATTRAGGTPAERRWPWSRRD